jgi:hypothetical protein
MRKEFCDICKKEIIDNESVSVGHPPTFVRFSLCPACGKPIVDFMKKKKLIEDKKKK